jgi:hypothetical protein
MSLEELERLGDEILQMAQRNPLFEEIAVGALARFHEFFVERGDARADPREAAPPPPQLRIPGGPSYSMPVNPLPVPPAYPSHPGVPMGGPLGAPAGLPPAGYPYWAPPYYPHP